MEIKYGHYQTGNYQSSERSLALKEPPNSISWMPYYRCLADPKPASFTEKGVVNPDLVSLRSAFINTAPKLYLKFVAENRY
jgi:hypothetical protein